jgi:hypothetical protein
MIRTTPGYLRLAMGSLVLAVGVLADVPALRAESVTSYAVKDNSIFQNNDKANGIGVWIAAGQNNSSQIQRGLIQFDLAAIPAAAQVSAVTLNLYVVDVPKTDKAKQRSFWVQALQGIGTPSWGEGASDAKDVGQGVAAQPGDATWYYKQYNTVSWPTGRDGALAAGPLGDPVGVVPANISPDPTNTTPYLVSWKKSLATDQLVQDVQAGVDGSVANNGWVLVGEEGAGDALKGSKRQFASREAGAYQPSLLVEYAVPEPAVWALGLSGLIAWVVMRRATSRKRRALR